MIALVGTLNGINFYYLNGKPIARKSGGGSTRLKVLDRTHKRGKPLVVNGITHVHGVQLLEQFNYTPASVVQKILPFKLRISNADLALTITDFDMAEVGFVAGAIHVELTYGVLDFDFDGLDYDLHLAAPMVLEPDTLPSGLGTQLCVLGIRFYQEVDGALYVLNAKESVGIAVLKCI